MLNLAHILLSFYTMENEQESSKQTNANKKMSALDKIVLLNQVVYGSCFDNIYNWLVSTPSAASAAASPALVEVEECIRKLGDDELSRILKQLRENVSTTWKEIATTLAISWVSFPQGETRETYPQCYAEIENCKFIEENAREFSDNPILITNDVFRHLLHIKAIKLFRNSPATSLSATNKSITMDDKDVELFSHAVSNGALPRLQILGLNNNDIHDSGIIALAGAIGALTSLEELRLSNNYISDSGIIALAPPICKLSSLKRLYLNKNDISLIGLDDEVNSVSLPALEEIWLNDNRICNAGMMALSKHLGKVELPLLKELRLDNNQFGDIGLSAFANAVNSRTLPALRSLLFTNAHEDISANVLAALRKALPNLEH